MQKIDRILPKSGTPFLGIMEYFKEREKNLAYHEYDDGNRTSTRPSTAQFGAAARSVIRYAKKND